MKPGEYIDVLRLHDDVRHIEWPVGFNWGAANDEASRFAVRLSDVLAIPVEVETGAQIQDASFHTQYWLPFAGGIEIRFSNFGRMVSVRSVQPVPAELLHRITALLGDAGYQYIPASVLDQRYTGPVEHVESWYHRFFEWL